MRITIYDNRDTELSTHTFGTENSLRNLRDILDDGMNTPHEQRDQTATKCLRALKEAITQAIAEHQ